ncbi:hypothetical protein AAU61_01015 [Desulfocarbo indianensis]|nr:hypothetical protein AAU61_01015 [Desulfocarbo indianensis]
MTLLWVQHSLRNGDLLLVPTYDDIEYMADALQRLQVFDVHGPKHAVWDFIAHPPHGPLASLVALAGFAVWGVHDWAPYAVNGILLFAWLLALRRSFGENSPVNVFFWMAFCLTLPISGHVVMELRPDLGCGLLTAWLLVCLGEDNFLAGPKRRLIGIGIGFGLALWAKPSVSLATLFYLGSALIILTLRDWAINVSKRAIKSAVLAWSACLLPALIIFLPFLLITDFGPWRYMLISHFGQNQEVWTYGGTWWQALTYHLTGPGGTFMFGRQFVLLVLASAAGLITAWTGGREARLRLAAWGALLAATFLVPLLTPEKQRFFAAAFDCLLILLAGRAMGRMSRSLSAGRPGWVAAAGLAAVFLAGFLVSYWPDYVPREGARAIRAMQTGVAETIAAQAGESRRPLRVFYTSVGASNPTQLRYLLLKLGVPSDVVGLHLSQDLDSYRKEIDQADFVVAIYRESDNPRARIPSQRVERQSLEIMLARKDYRKIKEFWAPPDQNLSVFARREP